MSDNLISVEPGFPAKINLKIIDNNKKIDVEFDSSIETTLLLHNLNSGSHPSLLNGLVQLKVQTDEKVSDLMVATDNLADKDIELENKINQNKNGDAAISFSVATPTLHSHAATKDYVDNKVGRDSNVITGLGLSALLSVITVAAGYCLDSALTKIIDLAIPLSKTLTLFAVGNGNGSLDTSGTILNKTFYVYVISKLSGQSDVLFSLSSSNPTLPNEFVNFRNIGFFSTNSSGVPSLAVPGQDIQSAYTKNLLVDSNLSNISALAKKTVVNLAMPNYAAGVVKSWGVQYTADSYGWLCVNSSDYISSTDPTLTINGVVFQLTRSSAANACYGVLFIPISEGDVYKGLSGYTASMTFYPAKGAN